jgi:hypothetical protein
MDTHVALARVEALYSGLAPGRTGELRDAYSADAYFRDPFNEVRGPEAIERIFVHMFQQLDSPRFVVIERAVDERGVDARLGELGHLGDALATQALGQRADRVHARQRARQRRRCRR